MSEEAIIGRRYTLVIPKSVRKRIGLKEGPVSYTHLTLPTTPYV